MGNWFHKTYTTAQKQENNFIPISLPWTVHPERDQAWRDEQDVDLGKRNAAQECDCDFLSSGNTVIEPDILTWYEQNIVCEPVEKRGIDRSYWIWEYPDPMKFYAILADVARGDGSDYSAFHVIDIDSMSQVAEFQSQLGTREYANVLVSAATEYNQALLVVENNNIGWDVVQSIVESGYTNMYYSLRTEANSDFSTYINKYERSDGLIPGFSMNQRTRPLAIEKMRDSIENKIAVIKSRRLIEELRVFIWKNNKQQAMNGYNDDLVLSFSMGMYLRETSLRYRKTAESLTYSSLNNFSKTTSDNQLYNANSQLNQNPWTMQIQSNQGQHSEDLRWLM
jgi:hypothetical protein